MDRIINHYSEIVHFIKLGGILIYGINHDKPIGFRASKGFELNSNLKNVSKKDWDYVIKVYQDPFYPFGLPIQV